MTRGQSEQFRDEVRRLSDNDAAEYIMRQVAQFEVIAARRAHSECAAKSEQAVQDFIAGVLA